VTQRFDETWEETVRIDDGTPVRLRLVRPADKQAMRAAFERLSPESRYRRFFAAKTDLSESDLRYLTETDGQSHLALGAERADVPEALGVARFVRLRERPDTAEAAIVVVDDFQGKGLGRLLLSRLAAAARERGVVTFHADVLARNEPMRALLRSLAPSAVEHADGIVMTIDIPTAEAAAAGPAPEERAAPLYRLLRLAASGLVSLRKNWLDKIAVLALLAAGAAAALPACRDHGCEVPCTDDSDCPAARRCDERVSCCVSAGAPCALLPLPDACACRADADCASGMCLAQALGPTCTPVVAPLASTIELGSFPTAAVGGTGDVPFDLPAGSVAFTIIAESAGEQLCLHPRRLVDPSGFVWYDRSFATAPLVTPWTGYPVLTLLVPDNDWTAPPPAGTWTISVDTYACAPPADPVDDFALFGEIAYGAATPVDGVVDRLAVIPKEAPGGTLHVNLHLTPVTGITTAAAPNNEFIAGFLARFWEVYGADGAGYEEGVTTYYDASSAFDTIDDSVEQYQACAAIAEPAPDAGPAMNLLLVGGFDGDLAGIIGVAAAIPGALVHAHVYQACVVMEIYPLSSDVMGTVVAHEVGHFFGLRHTTELGGGFVDAITDTPECPPALWMNPSSCPDWENVMFPISGPEAASRGTFSPGQTVVLSGVPALR
jgi:GNAT superfamily N-acetyltransferase